MSSTPSTTAAPAAPAALSHIAIVTGARGGIGRQVVQRLRTQGHRVAVVGRDAASLDSLAADARIAADTTEPQGAQAAIAACVQLLGGPPALLAHCVGSTLIAPLHRTTAAQWREVMRVNLDSAAFMLQAWVSALRDAQTRQVQPAVVDALAPAAATPMPARAAAPPR